MPYSIVSPSFSCIHPVVSLLAFQLLHPTPARNDRGPIIPARVSWNAYASTRELNPEFICRYTELFRDDRSCGTSRQNTDLYSSFALSSPIQIPLNLFLFYSNTNFSHKKKSLVLFFKLFFFIALQALFMIVNYQKHDENILKKEFCPLCGHIFIARFALGVL